MADIAASDVTYAVVDKSIQGDTPYRVILSDVTFGDGALTYPAAGVALTKGKLGLPNHIVSVSLVEPAAGNGFVYKYDASAETIRIYQGDNDAVADGPLIELVGGAATPAAATLRLSVVGY